MATPDPDMSLIKGLMIAPTAVFPAVFVDFARATYPELSLGELLFGTFLIGVYAYTIAMVLTLIYGAPVVWLLRRFNRLNLWSVSAAALGVPLLILIWDRDLSFAVFTAYFCLAVSTLAWFTGLRHAASRRPSASRPE